jgi:hypothetical protein
MQSLRPELDILQLKVFRYCRMFLSFIVNLISELISGCSFSFFSPDSGILLLL